MTRKGARVKNDEKNDVREPDAGAYLASERGRGRMIDPKRGLCQIRSPARTPTGQFGDRGGAQASLWRYAKLLHAAISWVQRSVLALRPLESYFKATLRIREAGVAPKPDLHASLLWTQVSPPRRLAQERQAGHFSSQA